MLHQRSTKLKVFYKEFSVSQLFAILEHQKDGVTFFDLLKITDTTTVLANGNQM